MKPTWWKNPPRSKKFRHHKKWLKKMIYEIQHDNDIQDRAMAVFAKTMSEAIDNMIFENAMREA